MTKMEKSPEQWYRKLPKDEDIDDSVFRGPIDNILKSLADDFQSLGIDHIIGRYRPVMSEFYELSAMYRTSARKYNAIFENFLATICEIYEIEREPMIVYPHKYSTKDWGNVYWEFLHLSSILLSYAFEMGRIDSLLNFPTLVYNIDVILPCPKCAYHYSLIKNDDDVKQVIKSMSFGSVIISLQIFHNIITANVDKTPDYANFPNRDRFLISDFALRYKCIDVQSENLKMSDSYSKSCIDWQPTTHVLLSIILSTYCSQPSYDRASNLLKYRLYSKSRAFSGMNFSIRNADMRPMDAADMMYISMTGKQLQYCLVQALLLKFQDTAIPPAAIEKNKRLNYALATMYKKFNAEMQQLVNQTLPNDDQRQLRESLLNKLDRVKTINFDVPTMADSGGSTTTM